jgi:hypothetical protein
MACLKVRPSIEVVYRERGTKVAALSRAERNMSTGEVIVGYCCVRRMPECSKMPLRHVGERERRAEALMSSLGLRRSAACLQMFQVQDNAIRCLDIVWQDCLVRKEGEKGSSTLSKTQLSRSSVTLLASLLYV